METYGWYIGILSDGEEKEDFSEKAWLSCYLKHEVTQRGEKSFFRLRFTASAKVWRQEVGHLLQKWLNGR